MCLDLRVDVHSGTQTQYCDLNVSYLRWKHKELGPLL
ncbi:unnamed protein product [Schistosoma curassoni]|uniref:Transposase n=1 Tax=Schistosoma curassoni TaxID=6186 RepID=A0A183JFB5_9TREM|nr:unnamed protein product [Schistosoma curassoni]